MSKVQRTQKRWSKMTRVKELKSQRAPKLNFEGLKGKNIHGNMFHMASFNKIVNLLYAK